jgi:hypothetical protein
MLYKDGVHQIYPPTWVEVGASDKCNKCCEGFTGKPFNCRTCGDLFCEDCTVKMMVPPAFEKKGKSGPSRVCHECRYKQMEGALLIETPMPPPSVHVSALFVSV